LDKLDDDLFGEGATSDEEEDEDEVASEGSEVEEGGSELSEEADSEDEDQIMSEQESLAEFYTDEDEEVEGELEEEWGGIDKTEVPLKKEESTSEETEVSSGAAPAKYIPPALRKQQAAAASQDAEDPRLRRQLLGLLNRLSPTSFPTLILNPSDPTSLHSIYMTNPRAIVSRLLTTLFIEIVSSQGDGIGETQAVVLAALVKVISTGLVGGMSASGGKELAGSLIDEIVKKLDGKDGEMKGKERQNLVGFVAMLYNAQVIACNLVYDLIKEFILNGLGEDDVEALLRVVRGEDDGIF